VLIAPALPLALIHPTAWKWNSANFALTELSEVSQPTLCSGAYTFPSDSRQEYATLVRCDVNVA
jgi:hypothetical protein